MSWIQTYKGLKVDPLNLQVSDIDLEDIAHSLSHQCRYTGHVNNYLCVAEHSVILSQYFLAAREDAGLANPPKEETALMRAKWALLHDAGETYLVDVPRPIKGTVYFFLDGNYISYKELEESIIKVVAEKFNLPYPIPKEVMEADTRILLNEKKQLFDHPILWEVEKLYKPLPKKYCKIQNWSPKWAEMMFKQQFELLFKE